MRMKAFPSREFWGMDLRDWFAGLAMQSLRAHTSDYSPFEKIAESSYKYADAMMIAREHHDSLEKTTDATKD